MEEQLEASTPSLLLSVIAQRLTANRKARGWTQQDLADRSGVHRVSVVKAEAGRLDTTISAQRQGRHVLGARQYGGGSYFDSADDAQRVLNDFHSGAAEVLGTKGSDIVVRARGVSGVNVNPRSGYPFQPTDVFFIKGTTSPSVVPYNPSWKATP